MRSLGSKGWGFRKVTYTFPYFLFSASYSLFLCVFAPLRALRETKKFVPLSLRDFVLKKIAYASLRVNLLPTKKVCLKYLSRPFPILKTQSY